MGLAGLGASSIDWLLSPSTTLFEGDGYAVEAHSLRREMKRWQRAPLRDH